MRILCGSDKAADNRLMDTFERAAALCLEKEGLDPDRAEISLSFVSKEEIHRLNSMYRNVDAHTDVLSFPLIEDFNDMDEDEELILGDVVICREQAREQAKEYGHSEEREVVYLFVHSVLHLLGYDHMDEDEKKVMRTREEEIMSEMGLEREIS